MGPYREISVSLQRDALNTPWGFRLQGGKDFKAPLTIQRVFVGSPADGELHRGDVILSIENHDGTDMIHKQAMDVIKNAGGIIMLRVRRAIEQRYQASAPSGPATQPGTQFYRSQVLDTRTPKSTGPMSGSSFGVDYSRRGYPAPAPQRAAGPPHGMLNRVQQSLNQALWSPGPDYDQQGDEDYQHLSVSDLKGRFAGGQPKSYQAPRSYNQPVSSGRKQWKRPDHGSGVPSLPEPGWTPGSGSRQHGGGHAGGPGWAPVRAPGTLGPSMHQPSYNAAPHPVNAAPSHHQGYVPHVEQPSRPAWAGTLKSSGGPKPWEVHAAAQATAAEEAAAHHMPQQRHRGAPQQHVTAQPMPGPPPGAVQPHQPRVQNVHYAPGDAPQYQQNPSDPSSDTARIAHLQYNTPIGLYSKQNVQEALEGQTKGKPGEGTMIVV